MIVAGVFSDWTTGIDPSYIDCTDNSIGKTKNCALAGLALKNRSWWTFQAFFCWIEGGAVTEVNDV
jgi:hypothetical protein